MTHSIPTVFWLGILALCLPVASGEENEDRPRRIVVCPIDIEGEGSIPEGLGQGVAELLRIRLQGRPGFVAYSLEETLAHIQAVDASPSKRDMEAVVQELVRRMEADLVVYGRVRQSGSSINVHVRVRSAAKSTSDILCEKEVSLDTLLTLDVVIYQELIVCLSRPDAETAAQVVSPPSSEAFRWFCAALQVLAGSDSFYESRHLESQKCALEAIQRAIAADPDFYAALVIGSRLALGMLQHIEQSTLTEKGARIGRADKEVEDWVHRACELRPNESQPHTLQGLLLLSRGEGEAAERALRHALILNDTDVDAWRCLGFALRRQARPVDAEAAYEKALLLAPAEGMTWHNLGVSRSKRGDLKGAAECFEKAIERYPQWSGPHTNLGMCLAQLGEWDRAQRHYETAISLEPGDFLASYNLGVLHMRKGDPREAAVCFKQTIEVRPDLGHAYNALAAAHFELGEIEDARKVVQAARERGLGSAIRPELLDEIDSALKAGR